jgi:hypothetical protein
VVETGLLTCPPEKGQQNSPSALRADFLRSGSRARLCGIAAISRDFQDKAGGFLCRSDSVVALPGIEPGFED